ncbi:MAG: sensor histidine kinase [Lachnospiraceae bacterium]|nr:sensor histidine kinase [Lachnospiraceae bacterium]
MTDTQKLLDYTFLLLLCVLEMQAYACLLQPLAKRREKIMPTAVWSALAALALFLWTVASMTKNATRDIYSYRCTAEYYLTIAVWIYAVYRSSLQEALYWTLLIFMSTRAVRHIIGHLLIIADGANYLVEGSAWRWRLLACLFLFVVYLTIFTCLKKFLLKEKAQDGSWLPQTENTEKSQKNSWLHLLLLASAAVPVLYSGAFAESLGQNGNWSRGLDAILVESLASICGLFCVLGYEWMLKARRRESDLAHMEQILCLQHRQYETKKESIELINQKYHDLKKSLTYLEQLSADERRLAGIQNLKAELKKYETIFQTGNETLDIVLFDKNEKCQKEQIRLIFMLDGSDLSFLNPFDITAIFGNALDNAIEEAQKQASPDQKEITMKVSSRPGWLILRFENYCDPSRLLWQDGKPATTKAQKEFHGFGLDSIRYAVKKYNGNMAIEVKDGKFAVNIMFPQETGTVSG